MNTPPHGCQSPQSQKMGKASPTDITIPLELSGPIGSLKSSIREGIADEDDVRLLLKQGVERTCQSYRVIKRGGRKNMKNLFAYLGNVSEDKRTMILNHIFEDSMESSPTSNSSPESPSTPNHNRFLHEPATPSTGPSEPSPPSTTESNRELPLRLGRKRGVQEPVARSLDFSKPTSSRPSSRNVTPPSANKKPRLEAPTDGGRSDSSNAAKG